MPIKPICCHNSGHILGPMVVSEYNPDGALVDGGAVSPEAVLQPVAGSLLRRHPGHLLLHALQHLR